jgi:hypothetical protein
MADGTFASRESNGSKGVAGRELSQFGYPLAYSGNARPISTPEQAYWRARGKAARLLMTGYWADNWYKLSRRARCRDVPDSSLPVALWSGAPEKRLYAIVSSP